MIPWEYCRFTSFARFMNKASEPLVLISTGECERQLEAEILEDTADIMAPK